jgi:hypothetical protein
LYFKYPYQINDGREDEHSDVKYHILRGGTFFTRGATVCCAVRYCFPSDGAEDETGFRVALCPIPPVK